MSKNTTDLTEKLIPVNDDTLTGLDSEDTDLSTKDKVFKISTIGDTIFSDKNTDDLDDGVVNLYASETNLANSDIIAAKADKTNVLELDNTVAYAPSSDYHPATKSYVDSIISFGFFGDGSDGVLTIASGETVNLSTGVVYQYTSVDIQVGGTLSTTDTSGIIMIKCSGTFNIDGTLDLGDKLEGTNSNAISLDMLSYSVSNKSTGTGGTGGSGGDDNNITINGGSGGIFGGGGGGGGQADGSNNGLGGNGGSGASFGGLGGIGGTGVASGGFDGVIGGGSAGGGGAASIESGTGVVTGGTGGDSYGNNGAIGVISGTADVTIAAGGGGAGGKTGCKGGGLLLYTASLTGTGLLNLAGCDGTDGGTGGAGTVDSTVTGRVAGGGGGGAGGGAGAGGNALVVYGTDTSTFTKNVSAGAIGLGGTGGISAGVGASEVDGTDGADGNTGDDGEYVSYKASEIF